MEEIKVTYFQMFGAIQKLIGRRVRTKLSVTMWGDLYNKKKQGIIRNVNIDGDSVKCLVVFKWTAMKGYQQQELWIKFENLEFKNEI